MFEIENNIFRKACSDEVKSVSDLYRSVKGLPGCIWNENYPTENDAYSDFDAGCLYVYEADGEIIGSVSVVSVNELDEFECWSDLDGKHCEIARLCVKRGHQGHGFGRDILNRLLEILKNDGYTSVRVLAAERNHAALKLYEKNGFDYLAECDLYGKEYLLGEYIF